MGQSTYGVANEESRRCREDAMRQRRAIEALRADLAQLDEWLTACEELRLLDQWQIPRALASEIAQSPVAPSYLQREARHRDRAILQVTDAIFVAQGELMAKLNILEGSVLWFDVTATKVGRRTVLDLPEPEDYRITPRPRPCRQTTPARTFGGSVAPSNQCSPVQGELFGVPA